MRKAIKSAACVLPISALCVGSVWAAEKRNILDTAVEAGTFESLAAALTYAGLSDTLKGDGPFTVFAPTDAAFAKLSTGTMKELLKPENKLKLQAVLKFHVIPGEVVLSEALEAGSAKTVLGEPIKIRFADGKVLINDASLQTADVKASNGVIHVIDSVLMPPAPKNDIASVAKNNGNFKTLLAAVEAAGLTSVLQSKRPITVLAPTDAAFNALPTGTVESLLQPENKDKLKEILTLHVLKGRISAGDALNAKSASAVSGGSLKFLIDEGKFQVNGATIVSTDIQCDNGVIHVIDAVLLPSEKKSSNDGSGDSCQSAISPAMKLEGKRAGEERQFEIAPGVMMTFCYCPPGSFTMGSPRSESSEHDEGQVQVRLPQGFWLARTETTQAQWQAVMGGNPSEFKGANLPVETVSWEESKQFLAKLNATEGLPAGWKWALPTEAQWEYACRAGTTTAFSFGDSASSRQANFNGDLSYEEVLKGPNLKKTTAVGSYAANAWGLYDMHGNVWEWCADDTVLPSEFTPVFRGGSWICPAINCRSANRVDAMLDTRFNCLGFRLALVPSK